MTGNLPKEGKKIYEKAYRSALEYYGGDKETASKVAWSVVKKKYKKNTKDNVWEKRACDDSWKYMNVDVKEVLKTAQVDRSVLNGITGQSEEVSTSAEWDDDLKVGICHAVDEQDKDVLRKIANADVVYNKILLDNYIKRMVQ